MKKQNNIICTVLLVALIIAIPLAVFLIRDIDNDTWFMLNHGGGCPIEIASVQKRYIGGRYAKDK